MYSIGSYVVKNVNGICKVEDIVYLDTEDGSKKQYYLLKPADEPTGTVYVPVDHAEKTTRRVMTEEEVWKLIDHIGEIDEIWIDNEKQREMRYKEAIRSRDPKVLVGIIKMLFLRRQERLEQGKKSTATDDKFFKLAEEYLHSEIGFVLNMDKGQVRQLITDSVQGRLQKA